MNRHQKMRRFDELDIPNIYETFPDSFHMHINGWSFANDREVTHMEIELSTREIKTLKALGLYGKIRHIHGNRCRVKRLRSLDIEIADDQVIDAMNALGQLFQDETAQEPRIRERLIRQARQQFSALYQDTCTQRCPHCFNQEDDFYIEKIANGQKLMKWDETRELLLQAKQFGLEIVKFLGIGEIFKNTRLFEILDFFEENGIKIAVFTKGTALGDDNVASRCGFEGIRTAEALVKRLANYRNLSILLGANSFEPDIQDAMVGCGKDGGVRNYTEKRNNALKLLVKYGFNDPKDGKRLALIAAPATPVVSDEIVDLFEWGIKRNMPVISIPTMVSGKGTEELEWLFHEFETNETLIQRYDPGRRMTREQRYVEWVVDFYTDMYSRALSLGITSLDTLNKEGLSGYAAAAKCQQSHNGMYIRLTGSVQECPGRCVGAEITSDLRTNGLIATWIGSRNYRRTPDCRALCSVKMKDLTGIGTRVCDCCEVFENVGSIPVELEERVLKNLNRKAVHHRRKKEARNFSSSLLSFPSAA